nr:PREDICTED: butyrophilin subfamily 1 member A1-like [Lepisosteus oculatus]
MKSFNPTWFLVTVMSLLLQPLVYSESDGIAVLGPDQPVAAFVGEDIVLPCYLSPSVSAVGLEVRWFTDDFHDPVCLYLNSENNIEDQNPSYRGRAELFQGELDRGNISLRLSKVQVSDEGLYRCLAKSKDWYEEVLIEVTVKALGTQPSVSLQSREGGQSQLVCRSEGWYPRPVVTWMDRDGQDLTSLSNITLESNRQGLLSVSSFIPVKQESGVFSCIIRSSARESNGESQFYMSRDFFPEVSMWMVAFFVISAPAALAFILLIIPWKIMNEKEHRCEIAAIPRLREEREWKWLCSAADDVTLDPESAHRNLALSEGGMRVREAGWRDLPDTPQRFGERYCVRSRQGFSAGRHYWEVEVNERWTIGVTRESAEKKGEFGFTPQEGYWALGCYSSKFRIFTDPPTPLPLSLKSRRVGIYVDVEEKQVSYYNAESRTHLYTFGDMHLNEREKVYLFFWTTDNTRDIAIVSPGSIPD